ncbi:hypothetical protein ACFE04_017573 [Oxalis oulophora]
MAWSASANASTYLVDWTPPPHLALHNFMEYETTWSISEPRDKDTSCTEDLCVDCLLLRGGGGGGANDPQPPQSYEFLLGDILLLVNFPWKCKRGGGVFTRSGHILRAFCWIIN